MKTEFKITREEAEAIIRELMHAFVSRDDEKIIHDLIRRLERELSE